MIMIYGLAFISFRKLLLFVLKMGEKFFNDRCTHVYMAVGCGELGWVELRGDVRYPWTLERLVKDVKNFIKRAEERYSKYIAKRLKKLIEDEGKIKEILDKYGIVIIGVNDWFFDIKIIWLLWSEDVEVKWHGYNCKRYIKNGSVVAEECSALSPLDEPLVRARKDVVFYIGTFDEIMPD